MKMLIRYTIHALKRMVKFGLSKDYIENVIMKYGKEIKEGKTKVKFVFKSKRGTWIAICNKTEDRCVVITVTRTH